MICCKKRELIRLSTQSCVGVGNQGTMVSILFLFISLGIGLCNIQGYSFEHYMLDWNLTCKSTRPSKETLPICSPFPMCVVKPNFDRHSIGNLAQLELEECSWIIFEPLILTFLKHVGEGLVIQVVTLALAFPKLTCSTQITKATCL